MLSAPESGSDGETMHVLNLTHLGLEINFLDRKAEFAPRIFFSARPGSDRTRYHKLEAAAHQPLRRARSMTGQPLSMRVHCSDAKVHYCCCSKRIPYPLELARSGRCFTSSLSRLESIPDKDGCSRPSSSSYPYRRRLSGQRGKVACR